MWYQRGFLADGTDALQGGDLPSIAFGHSRHSISLDRVPTPSLQATFVFLSSAVQRWLTVSLPSALTQLAKKRLFSLAMCTGPSGGCAGYWRHRTCATWLAQLDRTLLYNLDWRFRPEADANAGRQQALRIFVQT